VIGHAACSLPCTTLNFALPFLTWPPPRPLFTEHVRVDIGGNVGIGTTAPVNKLDVNGSVAVGTCAGSNSAPASSLIVSGKIGVGTANPGTTLEVADYAGAFDFGFYNSASAVFSGASVWSNIENATSATEGENLQFLTSTGGTKAERMRITGAGNVGIGVTSPGSLFEVQGTPPDPTVTTLARFRSNLASAGAAPVYVLGVNRQNSTTAALYIGNDGSSNAILAANNRDLRIGRDLGGSFTEYVRVSNAGNFGIGTTAPAFALDVTGDARATGCVKYGSGAGTSLGGTCASDACFKRDVTPITGALSRLSLLRPVHYRYRSDEFPGRGFGTELEAGFIAQELREVFPAWWSKEMMAT